MIKSNKLEYKLMYKREIIIRTYRNIMGSTNKIQYSPLYTRFPIEIVRRFNVIRFFIKK